jgi:hypothetical protein
LSFKQTQLIGPVAEVFRGQFRAPLLDACSLTG